MDDPGAKLATPVCELLGIETPILQGGMATYTSPELVAAVCEAGGLGILGALRREPEVLRADIARIRELTPRPFGVNHVVSQLDPAGLEVTMDERPPVLSLSWGVDAGLFDAAHEREMRVVHQVNSAEEARAAADAGADVIVAQGTEGGGHVGFGATMALVPATVDAVDPTPVIAAGGIADGRGIAAALMLGAQGALLGTRFLATPEAPVGDRFREAIVGASGADAVASTFLDDVLEIDWPGAQVRALRNPLLERWTEPAAWRAEVEAIQPELMAAIQDEEFVLAGEASGLIGDVVPAGELVRRLTDEAVAALRRAARLADASG